MSTWPFCIIVIPEMSCWYPTSSYTYFTGDLPNQIEVESMITVNTDFGIVSESERATIMTHLNANNISTSYSVTKIDGASGMYLEAKSSFMCLTTFVTRKQYLLFLEGGSIEDRIERFKFAFDNQPSCLLHNMDSDEQSDEPKNKKMEEQIGHGLLLYIQAIKFGKKQASIYLGFFIISTTCCRVLNHHNYVRPMLIIIIQPALLLVIVNSGYTTFTPVAIPDCSCGINYYSVSLLCNCCMH